MKRFAIFFAGMVVMFLIVIIIGKAVAPGAAQAFLQKEKLQPAVTITYSNYYGQLMDPTTSLEHQVAAEWQAGSLDPAHFSAMVLSSVLGDPRGWSAAGISFKPGDSATPHITFEWLFPDQMSKYCDGGSDVLGCTRNGGPDQCTVYLAVGSQGYAINWYNSPSNTTQMVNHEVGHCLGFGHTKDGLMAPTDTGRWNFPSPDQINEVRNRLSVVD